MSQVSQEEQHDSFLEQRDALSQMCGYGFCKMMYDVPNSCASLLCSRAKREATAIALQSLGFRIVFPAVRGAAVFDGTFSGPS